MLEKEQGSMPFAKLRKQTAIEEYWKKETLDEMKSKSKLLRKEIEKLRQ